MAFPLLTKKPLFKPLQKRVAPSIITRLQKVYDLTKEIKDKELECKKLKDSLYNEMDEDKYFLIETADGLKEGYKQVSKNPVLTDNMNKAKKKLGEKLFMRVIKIAVTTLREIAGDNAVEMLKVDDQKVESIRFRCYKP